MKPVRIKSLTLSAVEPLESRISPARIIIAGVPNNSANLPDTEYTDTDPVADALFLNTEENPLDPISAAVGPGLGGIADTFYLRLSKGDELQIFNNTGSVETSLKVKSGNLVAYFVDHNLDNEVQETELTGISIGKNANFELRGSLSGDIVTNLNEQGTKSLSDDTVDMTGTVSHKQGIAGIRSGGSVGKIIAGGAVNNLSINGNVQAVLSGNAADGEGFNFFSGDVIVPGPGLGTTPTPVTGGSGVLSVGFADGIAGTSIQNVKTRGVIDRIEAGGGGSGARGGNLTNIEVTFDSDGFSMTAGKGGDAGGTKKSGGAGGKVDRIYISGTQDTTSHDQGDIIAGDGGDSVTGTGGKGGSLTNVFVGFQKTGGVVFESEILSKDAFLAQAGDGGSGKVGGTGGSATNIRMLTSTAEGLGDEQAVVAGDGGDTLVASKGTAGKGGSVSKLSLRNQEVTIDTDTLVKAGDGGLTPGLSKGGSGGSLSNLDLLGFQFQVLAGNGSEGNVGGNGGSINKVNLLPGPGVTPDGAVISAGRGGDGNAGNGGKGGTVTSITANDADFAVFRVNPGQQGDGGASIGGKGGKGGDVTGVNVFDTDQGLGTDGDLSIRGGVGGDGDRGGGKGGEVRSIEVLAFGLSGEVLAGDGGAALVKGKGGGGGGINKASINSIGQVTRELAGVPTLIDVPVVVRGGTGGAGAGTSGSGGAGGEVSSSLFQFDGSVNISAGDGGAASGKGGGGRGGSLKLVEGFAKLAAGIMTAGDAGAGTAKAAHGGDITGKSASLLSGVFSLSDLQIIAGDGSGGGRGGSLKYIGYGSTSGTLVPTPTGNIDILAGDGSASANGKLAGAGGSILSINGAISSGVDTVTTIKAGNGGSGAFKAGNGGSLTNAIIERGGNDGVLFTIAAGDGGTVTTGQGGRGGDVKDIVVADIADTTNFRSIAAGDGGDASKKGGQGGSISEVRVIHGIGVRTGQVFGFDLMGGIFAGSGGDASAGAKGKGKAGSVSTVTADYIAAIVAGKAAIPELVESVKNVDVSGTNLLRDSFGSFTDDGIPGSELTFTFGPDVTARIAKGSSPAAVAGLLNGLPSVIAAGGVTVTAVEPAGYLITFNNTNDQIQMTGNEVVDLFGNEIRTGAGGTFIPANTLTDGNAGTPEVQELVTHHGFAFSVQFDDGVTFDSTAPIAAGTSAGDVQTILNALPTITAAGGVTVGLTGDTYTVTFVNNGDRNEMSLIAFSAVGAVTTEVEGAVESKISEVQSFSIPDPRIGAENSNVNETNSIRVNFGPDAFTFTLAPASLMPDGVAMQNALNSLPSIQNAGGVTVSLAAGVYTTTFVEPGDFPSIFVSVDGINDPNPGSNVVNTAPHVSTITQGNQAAGTLEVQRVFVDSGTFFSLQFDPDGAGPLGPGLSGRFSSSITPGALEQSLNNIQTIIGVGGVTVTGGGGLPFDITFNTADNFAKFITVAYSVDQPVTEVQKGANAPARNEVQQVTYDPESDFSVGLGNEFTDLFSGATVTAGALQSALNALASIQALGNVSVQDGLVANTFNVTFNTVDDKPQLESRFQITELQQVDLYGSGITQFQFGANPADITPPVAYGSDLAANSIAITNALNALPGVIAAGGVTATMSIGAIVDIQFNIAGDQPAINATQVFSLDASTSLDGDGVTFQEVQQITTPDRAVFKPLLFDPTNPDAANFIGSFSDAYDIQSKVFRYNDLNANGTFDRGDTPIDGLVMAKSYDQATANAIPEARMIGDFLSTTVTPGTAVSVEVQSIEIFATSFFLSFGGESTVALQGKASATQVQEALNALPSIAAAGGVAVVKNGTGNYSITFGANGDQEPITAFYDFLNILG